jgi:tRNA A-37 threonylcarbamoyl transferase component Bud32
MSAFLGAGSSARVFCVAKAGAPAPEELRALKVSTSLSRGELEHEIATLRAAADAGAPVVPPVDSSLRHFCRIDGGTLSGGGFLLQHVCSRAKLDSQASCAAAFRALRKLHAAGFVHGDARVPNLVQYKRDFLWIDMRESAADSLDEALHNDAQTLAASALRCPLSPELHAPVLVALNDVPAGGDAAYASVADAVWAALRPLAPAAASEELDE